MKKFLTIAVFVVVMMPVSVLGALSELPIGNVEKVVTDARLHTDYISVNVGVDAADGTWLATTYNDLFFFQLRDDGVEEPINLLARRSLSELQIFIGKELKKGVEKTIQAVGAKLEGRRLYVIYTLSRKWIKWAVEGGDDFIFGFAETEVIKKAEETQTVVQTLFKVDLLGVVEQRARTEIGIYPVVVSGIARARLTTEDEFGSPPSITESVNFSSYPFNRPSYFSVYPEGNILFVPLHHAISGKKGNVRVWYQDGGEQVFSLSDGSNLITYLSPPLAKGSPFKRLGVPKVTAVGVELPYEATDDEQVLIKRASPDFKVWEPLYFLPVYPPIVPTGSRPASGSLPVRIRTATAPLGNGFGFFKAEVVSPVAPQAAQKR